MFSHVSSAIVSERLDTNNFVLNIHFTRNLQHFRLNVTIFNQLMASSVLLTTLPLAFQVSKIS